MNYLKRIFSNTPDNKTVEFFRYASASAVAFAVDFSLLFLLVRFGLDVLVSNAVSFTAGLFITYIFSTRWVFSGSERKNKYVEFFVFAGVGVAALGVNELILFLFYTKIGLHHLVAKIIAAGVTVLFNYTLRKLLLFSKKEGAGKA